MKITKTQWRIVEPLLNHALELDALARARWLDGIELTNADSMPLLKALLAKHDAAEHAGELETVPKLTAPTQSLFKIGDVIGAYRLVSPIGRGGMGEVWLADQVDGRVTRQVALKLPTQVQHLDIWRRRFQRECNILAKLTHPNIARLFDAGVDDKLSYIGIGQPYLALEYIEGIAIDRHADANALSIFDRLIVFRQILLAVTHAHQRLVVHRDLKPSNILVARSGEVKLLDFGIAKLIDDATAPTDVQDLGGQQVARPATELTLIGGRALTLRYAAPEQLTGDAITTAADIYSLGVILHELITGTSPYREVREAKRLTETALLYESTSMPSMSGFDAAIVEIRGLKNSYQLRRQIAGDVDAIILKAMRKNPVERYQTVAALDDDIQRHLENKPVLARKGTWRYLASRFVMRHKMPMASAAILIVAIFSGVIAIERERRIAFAERERAERHFKAVRALANSLMFDVHDKLKAVPGSTPVRQFVIENASRYLAQLSTESSLDRALSIELADAYFRLANIQGQVDAQNVGKPEEALQSYQRAITLLAPFALFPSTGGSNSSADRSPTLSDDLQLTASRTLVKVYRVLSALQKSMGKTVDADKSIEAGANEAARLITLPQANLSDQFIHLKMVYERARSLASVKSSREIRLKGIEQAVAVAEALMQGAPRSEVPLDDVAWLYSEYGHALRADENPDIKRAAINQYQAALTIRNEQLENKLGGTDIKRAIVAHSFAIGFTYGQLGEHELAMKHLRAALVGMQQLAAGDPGNKQYQLDTVNIMSGVALASLAAGDGLAASTNAEDALALFQTLPEAMRSLQGNRNTEIDVRTALANASLRIAEERATKNIDKRALFNTARQQFVEIKRLHDVTIKLLGVAKSAEAERVKMQQRIALIDRKLGVSAMAASAKK